MIIVIVYDYKANVLLPVALLPTTLNYWKTIVECEAEHAEKT